MNDENKSEFEYNSPLGSNSNYNNNIQSDESTSENTTYRYAGDPYQGTPFKSKKSKEKKKPGIFKKAICIAGAAILFGTLAGSTMVGVTYLGNKYVNKTEKQETYDISTVAGNIETISNEMINATGDTDLTAYSAMNVQTVAKASLPAMVELNGTTTVTGAPSYYYGRIQSYEASTSGTGIIVGKSDTELLIVTNAHVIEEVSNLKCVFVDGSSVDATVKGSKSDQDIAVVAVTLSNISSDTLSKIAIAELADSDNIAVGQQVVAIGNALGEGQSVTTGIVSALNRSITVNNVTFNGLIMTDAAINSGNSGGALLDASGKVIAINFAKTSEDGVEGMAYSIPVSNVKDIINSLMSKQTRTKVNADEASYLGIAGMDITSAYTSTYGYPQGIMIRTVQSGSAADNAGLVPYDIIVGFDDQTVLTMSSLTSLLQYYAAGETITIDYYHLEGSEYILKSAQVTLGKKAS
ncbi:MAG: trypsin-like peptidase domain-containing protein [Eubacteriales bacterium]|nr:trypsin-like peptidase domain-containing protein [Eubacteriales bacterium]